jgi:aspartate ammonia-lyase
VHLTGIPLTKNANIDAMREERDFIGAVEIPDDALYGIHAARARANFPDNTPFHIEWYKAIGMVKRACYTTAEAYFTALNEKYGPPPNSSLLTHNFQPLLSAAAEVSQGRYFDAFIVPAISGGAGTSINMNVNEIIANVALISMGKMPGQYEFVDPVEHANIFQSTNDVVPTALKVASMYLLTDLENSINALRFLVEQHETRHQTSLRIGYTEMQEAVPSSYGKLFSSYSEALSRDWWRVSKSFERIKTLNLGGGAIGTGMAVPRYFIMEAIGHLQQLTRLPVTRSENLADATSNLDSIVEVHAILKAHAVNLEKMVSDLRLLASDITNPSPPTPNSTLITPNSTLITPNSLTLPPCQAGSSIMPGKVNPVIPEFVISAAHTIYANDQLITSLCAQGCLELNAYLPVIGHALLGSLKLLIACDTTLKQNLFSGLVIHEKAGEEQLHRSPAITTALLPYIGYNQASILAKEMKQTGEDIFQANQRLQLMEPERLAEALRPDNLLKMGYTGREMS